MSQPVRTGGEPGMLFVAQVAETEVCGEGLESSWLCLLVFRTTGNDLAARAVGGISAVLIILAILVGAFVVSRLLRRLVTRGEGRMQVRIERRLERAAELGAISDTERYRTRRLQRLQAISGVLRGVVATIVWLTAILVAIAVAGVRLQPILAGAGLIGIVIGFGAQQLVRDVLAGIAMLVEDQYGVGDWIEIDGVIGEVERVGLRATAMRDIDGTVHHVLNGSVQRVGNLSQEWARARFDVPLALGSDVSNAKVLIHEVATGLAADPVWGQDIVGEPEIWGVQSFGPEGLAIRVTMATKPLRNWDVTRQLRERLKVALEDADVRMPSQLIEVGGQRAGYALLTRELAGEEDSETQRRQRVRRTRAAAADAATSTAAPSVPSQSDADEDVADENPTGDLTTELRMEQGPLPRPD